MGIAIATASELKREYQLQSLRDLEFVVRECEAFQCIYVAFPNEFDPFFHPDGVVVCMYPLQGDAGTLAPIVRVSGVCRAAGTLPPPPNKRADAAISLHVHQ